MIYCPRCKTECSDTAARCISCGASLARAGTTRIAAPAAGAAGGSAPAASPATATAQTMPRGLAWALAAGAAVTAALIWVGISRATDMRLGFLVIGIAIAVGSAIGYSLDASREPVDGIVAVVLTVLGLFLAKAVLTGLMISDARAEIAKEVQADAAMISRLVGGIDEQQVGDAADVPPAIAAEAALQGEEPGVWAAAHAKWQGMSPAERDRMRATAAAEAMGDFEQIEGAWLGLGAFFGSLTGLGSTIVAIGIAWTLGSGVNRAKT